MKKNSEKSAETTQTKTPERSPIAVGGFSGASLELMEQGMPLETGQLLAIQRLFGNQEAQQIVLQRQVIQRRTTGNRQSSADTQRDEIVQLLSEQPTLSLEEAARIVAERNAPQEKEEDRGALGWIADKAEAAWEATTDFVGDLFNDLYGWVTSNKEEILLSVALSNPLSAAIIASGWAWSELLPLIVQHTDALWVEHILPMLSYEQLTELLNALEDSKLVGIINTLVTTGVLAPFIIAIGWDTEVINRIIFAIPKATLRELAEMDRIGFVNWLAQKFDAVWPVGTGYIITGRLGATFGYPIYVGAEGKEDVYRMEAERYELIKVGQLTVAGDTGAGIGGSLQLGPLQASVQGQAEAQAGLKFQAREMFDFPVATDDALLPFLLEIAPLQLTGIGQMIDPLIGLLPGLSAEPYRKEFTIEINPYGALAASAEAGLRIGGHTPEQAIEEGAAADGEQKGSWLDQLLPRALGMAGLELSAGMGLTIRPNFDTQEVGIELFANLGSSLQGGLVVSGGNIPVIREILRVRFGLPFAYDLEGEAKLIGTINGDTGEIEWTGYELKGESGVNDAGIEGVDILPGTGTSVTADYQFDDENTLPSEAERPVESWLYDHAPDTLRVERRMGLGRGAGGARWLLDRRDYLNTLIPREEPYRQFGAVLDGLLIAQFTLNKEQLLTLVNWLASLVSGEGDARTQALDAWQGIQTFFRTGEQPAWMSDLEPLRALFTNISLELEARYTVALAMAAELSAASGAKGRVDGGVTGARYTVLDLTQEAPEMVAELLTFIAENMQTFFGESMAGETQLTVPAEE